MLQNTVKNLKDHYNRSVMTYISSSLILILSVSLISMFISFRVTELADSDAKAINISGTLRMWSYRLGIAVEQEDREYLLVNIKVLDDIWQHPVFYKVTYQKHNPALSEHFEKVRNQWAERLRPRLLSFHATLKYSPDQDTEAEKDELIQALIQQVDALNTLVGMFEKSAENSITSLRKVQIIAMFATVLIACLIFYLLKNRIERPLKTLTKAAHHIGEGDFDQKIELGGRDELALMAATMQQTSQSLHTIYGELERLVDEKTRKLRHNNTTLSFLFNVSRSIQESYIQPLDHQQIIDQLSELVHLDDIELCLMTPEGNHSYHQFVPQAQNHNCIQGDCTTCKGDGNFSNLIASDSGIITHNFPLFCENRQHGVLVVRAPQNTPLQSWQERILQSAADQFAIALTLNEQKDKERRLTLMQERTTIARELHDSLAQALSYLQIQVTRLQKSQEKRRFDLQQPIIDELRCGLSSAYQQLRELLTTFRLQATAEGLHAALKDTVQKLLERSEINIHLNYGVEDIPFTPIEEIHLLQIVREASQNAVKHSKASRLDILLLPEGDSDVRLTIRDNGVGLPSQPEKLNHYGLAIMQERSRHLNGSIQIHNHPDGGVAVEFGFTPSIFLDQKKSA